MAITCRWDILSLLAYSDTHKVLYMARRRRLYRVIAIHRKPHTVLRRFAVQPRTVFSGAPCLKLSVDGYSTVRTMRLIRFESAVKKAALKGGFAFAVF